MLHIGMLMLFFLGWSQGQVQCPDMYPKIFKSYAPMGNLTGGTFTKKLQVSNLKECVADCCNQPNNCHVALIYNMSCYHIQCISSKMCTPLYRQDLEHTNPPIMVLIKPVEEDEVWSDFLDGEDAG